MKTVRLPDGMFNAVEDKDLSKFVKINNNGKIDERYLPEFITVGESKTNGNILVNNKEIKVYRHPEVSVSTEFTLDDSGVLFVSSKLNTK